MNVYKALEKEIISQWNEKLLGELKNVCIEPIYDNNPGGRRAVEPHAVTLMLSSMSAAVSTFNTIGKGAGSDALTLKSIKSSMDTSAGFAFSDFMDGNELKLGVTVSEGKDEHGNIVDDPLKQKARDGGATINVAVDVVDGTTLAAKGIDGAYSISAGAVGLKSFPDMQAYAIGGPGEVLDEIDFFKHPEEEVSHFIHLLSDYYEKQPSQIRIVTHSYDTGTHHKKLISKLESMGVTVIIPNPVIVEPPYVASMALHRENAPDGMIGVFGLPEIVINSLLCANISNKQELRFRVASNTMLKNPMETNLDLAFAFSADELIELNEQSIDVNKVYTKEDLADSLDESCFTAIALTNDPVLGFRGIRRNREIVYLETLFSGFRGLTLKVLTEHGIYQKISYPARHSLKLDDISAVAFLPEGATKEYLSDIIKQIEMESFDFIRCSEKDKLHVTVCEYGIHYGGYSGEIYLEFDNRIIYFREKLPKGLLFQLGNVRILENSIICDIQLINGDKEFDRLVLPEVIKTEFDNSNMIPHDLHITLGRFVEYVGKQELWRLGNFLKSIRKPDSNEKNFKADASLIHIRRTPFDDIQVLI